MRQPMVLLTHFYTSIYVFRSGPIEGNASLPLYLHFEIHKIVLLNEVLNFSMHSLLLEVNKFVLDYLCLISSLLESFHFLEPVNLLIFKLADFNNVEDVLHRKLRSNV